VGKSDVGHYGGETFVIISYNAGEADKGNELPGCRIPGRDSHYRSLLYMKHRSLDKTNTPTPIAPI